MGDVARDPYVLYMAAARWAMSLEMFVGHVRVAVPQDADADHVAADEARTGIAPQEDDDPRRTILWACKYVHREKRRWPEHGGYGSGSE